MTATADMWHIREVLADPVVDDRAAGVHRANRQIFADSRFFGLGITHSFERNWIYLAHESQVPDCFTTYMGASPS